MANWFGIHTVVQATAWATPRSARAGGSSRDGWVRALACGAALLLGSATAAHAKDFCVQITQTEAATVTWQLIGKGYAPPLKGKCKPWVGFAQQPSPGYSFPAAGAVCKSAANVYAFTITTQAVAPFGGIGTIVDMFTLPDGVGLEGNPASGASSTVTTTAAQVPCGTVPYPGPGLN